ncbi:MAG TPA: mechanosensitive ion channel [Saprospiraceae bacterium]|nr:mechanosensitive ion channel [Saprospiraceae bacterium]
MEDFLKRVIINFAGLELRVDQTFILILLLVSIALLVRFANKKERFTPFILTEEEKGKQLAHLLRNFNLFIGIIGLWLFFLILNIDYTFYRIGDFAINITLLLKLIAIVQTARLLDWFMSGIVIKRYNERREERPLSPIRIQYEPDRKKQATRLVQYTVYFVAFFLLLNNLSIDFVFYKTEVVARDGSVRELTFTFSRLISMFIIILVARMVVWFTTQVFLYSIYKRRDMDKGSQFAINQLVAYILYVIAIFLALDHVGINMTIIWTGAAALLVGVGLGLQQTFNDFISGIVILFERTTLVGDILEFDGKVGTVRKIGMRASVIETRNNISVIVPNSKLVNNSVINWTQYQSIVRFEINVGVAYGSDTALVKKVLLEAAEAHPNILPHPAPFVRFVDFGNSSLDFILYFFSTQYLRIEDLKSDLRFDIDRRFRENNITIPFPQRDIWIRKED